MSHPPFRDKERKLLCSKQLLQTSPGSLHAQLEEPERGGRGREEEQGTLRRQQLWASVSTLSLAL